MSDDPLPLRATKLLAIRNELEGYFGSRANLLRAMKMLSPREEVVLVRRLGLAGGRGETIRCIADSLHLNSTRVWNIQKKALWKLKDPMIKILCGLDSKIKRR